MWTNSEIVIKNINKLVGAIWEANVSFHNLPLSYHPNKLHIVWLQAILCHVATFMIFQTFKIKIGG
jgi:hypothetical protein